MQKCHFHQFVFFCEPSHSFLPLGRKASDILSKQSFTVHQNLFSVGFCPRHYIFGKDFGKLQWSEEDGQGDLEMML